MPEKIIVSPSVYPVSLADAKLHCKVDVTDEDSLFLTWLMGATQYAEETTWRALVAQSWKIALDRFPAPGLSTYAAAYGYGSTSGNVSAGPVLTATPEGKTGYEIFLPRPPLLSVDSIKYIDENGIQQTLATDQYSVDAISEPGRITPAYGVSWPATRIQANAVEIAFTCGYASAITANATSDTITPVLWPTLVATDKVVLSNSGGALPAPLVAGTTYYVQSVTSPGVYKLSATSGGGAIDLTDAGTGTSYIGAVPEGIKSWILLRVGTMYKNRSEVDLQGGIRGGSRPFFDSLLDYYSARSY